MLQERSRMKELRTPRARQAWNAHAKHTQFFVGFVVVNQCATTRARKKNLLAATTVKQNQTTKFW